MLKKNSKRKCFSTCCLHLENSLYGGLKVSSVFDPTSLYRLNAAVKAQDFMPSLSLLLLPHFLCPKGPGGNHSTQPHLGLFPKVPTVIGMFNPVTPFRVFHTFF